MNTRGARCERDVYAVIDEDGYVVFLTQCDRILGYLEELFHEVSCDYIRVRLVVGLRGHTHLASV